MGAEVDQHLLLPTPEHHAVGESGHARANFDGASASIIHDAVVESPARGVPGPASNGAVDERSPEEYEDHHGHEAAAFSDGTGDNSSRSSGELHLGEGQLSRQLFWESVGRRYGNTSRNSG